MNERLLKDVKKLGANQFNRTILYLCTNKKVSTYLELYELLNRRVLFSGSFYNDNISGKFFRSDFV
jgi:Putative endonuclease segE, GIY-YIG domain